MKENLDWKNIGFAYRDTGTFVKVEYSNGTWHSIEKCTDPVINLHVAATCLHYGQSCFEGIKAFTQKDGTVSVFRPENNAKRLIQSANRLSMIPPSVDLFLEAMGEAIKINSDYIPPYGTGASLYIRPLLIGTTPRVGLQPSENYTFYVLTMPVGPYYKDGFMPINALVQEDYDRAAPKGVGNIKAAGNYAAALKGAVETKEKGYPISLYLDSSEHNYIDEFGTSNFFGLTADNKYVTPDSSSILKSITNNSIRTIIKDFGYTIEQRPVLFSKVDQFEEIGACGTAAVITPIYSITRNDTVHTFGSKDKAGTMLTKLFNEIQGIQYGEIEDRYGWMREVK